MGQQGYGLSIPRQAGGKWEGSEVGQHELRRWEFTSLALRMLEKATDCITSPLYSLPARPGLGVEGGRGEGAC